MEFGSKDVLVGITGTLPFRSSVEAGPEDGLVAGGMADFCGALRGGGLAFGFPGVSVKIEVTPVRSRYRTCIHNLDGGAIDLIDGDEGAHQPLIRLCHQNWG